MLTRRARRDRRRAAALLWFLIVALPLMYLGMALAVDVARIVMVSGQAANVAEASAVAGAFQFRTGTATLDRTAARNVGMTLAQLSYSGGNVNGSLASVPDVRVLSNSYGTERVTVTVRTSVDTVLLGTVLNLLSGDPGATTITLSATRSADVCIPNRYTPTAGYCARPDGR